MLDIRIAEFSATAGPAADGIVRGGINESLGTYSFTDLGTSVINTLL